MGPDDIVFQVATWLIPLVIAIVLHEISHGWVAKAFGDPTASDLGRLSPNPIRHVDPIGTVVLPMVLAVTGAPVFGWAKPVPVIAAKMRNPRVHMMLVAAAGPATNLLLALIGAIAMALIIPDLNPGARETPFVVATLENFLLVNVFLAVFNMLPMPPFDGGHVVEGLLPRRLAARYASIGKYGFLLLILLIVVLPMIAPQANIVERIVVPPVQLILGFLLGLVGLA
jgi:Zn-dependent protease